MREKEEGEGQSTQDDEVDRTAALFSFPFPHLLRPHLGSYEAFSYPPLFDKSQEIARRRRRTRRSISFTTAVPRRVQGRTTQYTV